MRLPASTLVVDAAILVAAIRGRSSGVIPLVSRHATLATSDRVVLETRRRVELGLRRSELLSLVDRLVRQMTVVPVAALIELLTPAEIALREAVPSRNGSTRDAHVLALAWCLDADLWTTDRDLAATGVATWSTPNLVRSIADAEEARGWSIIK